MDWEDDWASGTNESSKGKGVSNANTGDDWDSGPAANGSTGRSFGGGRGGGGGGGGGSTCYNCGQSGHMSRECTEPKKERQPYKCFNCQGEGHSSRDCPEPRKPPRSCFNCGSADHMSRECPEPKKSRPMKCYNCQEDGHTSRDCTQPKKERTFTSSHSNGGVDDWGTDAKTTNTASNDDFDWGGGGNDTKASSGNKGGGSGCHNCGEEGHFSRECPKKEGGGGGGGSNECRRCKKVGHKAIDCTEEVLGEDGKPLPPPYKPIMVDENSDNLYETIPTGLNFDRYEKIKVNVSGTDPPQPITAFSDVITSPLMTEAIGKCKYTKPTPVQKYAIPYINSGRDLMACAQTGSGKTAAFVLPILQGLLAMGDLPSLYGQAVQEPLCVVISPTRELAIQIHTEAVKFAKGTIIKPCLIYGGTSVGHQLAQISRGAHFLVATPGRLLDFTSKGKIGYGNLKYLVLDEADRMIDQGFLPEVRKMISHESMPPKEKRQTLMFSATFPDEVQRAAQEFLKDDYLFLTVGIIGSANSDVEQLFVEVDGKQKRSKLMEVLRNSDSNDRTMIFVEKKKTADFLASYLSQNKLMSTSIHGDRFQSQREQALFDFRSGRMPVIVATSVAARGLDIKDVKHVINYDLPKDIDEYVHRIGRTGRVGNTGKATSFYDPSNDQDLALTRDLIKILEGADQVIPVFLQECSSGVRGTLGDGAFGGQDCRGDVPINTASADDDWN